jgi:chromosome segregation ATPase
MTESNETPLITRIRQLELKTGELLDMPDDIKMLKLDMEKIIANAEEARDNRHSLREQIQTVQVFSNNIQANLSHFSGCLNELNAENKKTCEEIFTRLEEVEKELSSTRYQTLAQSSNQFGNNLYLMLQ